MIILRFSVKRCVNIIKECDKKYTDNFALNIIDYLEIDCMELFEKMRKGKYVQDKIESNSYYVEPKQIDLKNGHFHYVPILENLKSLFKHKEIKKNYFESLKKPNPHVISSFYDSQSFSKNELFSNNMNSIQLKFFSDGFDLSRPLGDSRNTNKMIGVYYKIGNFDKRYLSIDYFTQLAMIFDSKLLKTHNTNEIFKPLEDDLMVLENHGIEIEYKNAIINLKGTISIYCADSLEANSLAGLVESFRHKVAGKEAKK